MIRERIVSVLRAILSILILTPLSAQGLKSQSRDTFELQTEQLASGFSGIVDIQSSGTDLWIAEKQGKIYRVDAESGGKVVVGTIDDIFQPERRGIYGIALDPAFPDSSWLYVHYPYLRSYPNHSWAIYSKVVRLRYDSTADRLVDPVIILDSLTSSEWSAGGNIIALEDRTLLVTTGDGVNFADEAQGMNTTRGKVLRVGLDGSTPVDNPWRDLPRPLNSIYATGMKDPQGMVASRLFDGIVSIDRGTIALDEINRLESGKNYGWNRVLGSCDGHPFISELDYCADTTFRDPLYEWYRAEQYTAAPIDIDEYRSGSIEHWKDALLIATELEGLHVLRVDREQRTIERLLHYDLSAISGGAGRPLRGVCVTDNGEVYLGVAMANGTDALLHVLSAETPPPAEPETDLQIRTVVDSLEVPWDLTWGHDNTLWVTERTGRISRVDPETGEQWEILRIDPAQVENTGLLGLAFHPAFCDSPYVYTVYTYDSPSAPGRLLERLSRFRYDEAEDTLVDELTLLDGVRVSGSHAGGRLVIGRDRMLYMTVSDADRTDSVQTTASLLGSIIRMRLDGSAPADNPFADQGFPAEYIWSFGHRNVQGLVLAPDGTLYASEHGPSTDDEVNRILPGRNYGWADVLGFCDTPYEEQYCEEFDVMEPLVAWTPTIAPAGLDFYASDVIAQFAGKLLMNTLKSGRLMAFDLSEDGTEIERSSIYFPYEFGRIRDVCIAPDGRVFISSSNRDAQGVPRPGDDRIIEISARSGHPPLPLPGALCDTIIIDTTTVDTGTGSASIYFTDRTVSGNLFPMPVRTHARIEFSQPIDAGTLTLYTLGGERVMQIPTLPGRTIDFDRGPLPAGHYIAEVRTPRNVFRILLVMEER